MIEKPDYLKVVRCETKGNCVWNKVENYCSFPGEVIVNEWAQCSGFKANYEKRRRDFKENLKRIDS